MKNPFKKKSITDSLINVGVGGAANVAIDYAWDAVGVDSMLPASETFSGETIKNAVKIVGGALVGSMVKSKVGRAMADGVATVGVSNLISGLITGGETKEEQAPAGLAKGTIGRTIPGNRRYIRNRVSGIGQAANAFMGK